VCLYLIRLLIAWRVMTFSKIQIGTLHAKPIMIVSCR